MRLFVSQLPQQEPIAIECLETDTVGHVMVLLANRLSYSMDRLKLVFAGQQLDSHLHRLHEIGINNETSLTVVVSPGMQHYS